MVIRVWKHCSTYLYEIRPDISDSVHSYVNYKFSSVQYSQVKVLFMLRRGTASEFVVLYG